MISAIEIEPAHLEAYKSFLGPIFIRVDVTKPIDLAPCLEQDIIPILFYPGTITPARFDDETLKALIESHLAAAKKLHQLGYNHLVLAADNDGAVQKMLSPRFSSWSLAERMDPLLIIFAKLYGLNPAILVQLCVEELAPQGLDATDGIAIAQALASLGLKEIIATAGTRDFMPLYDRRTTQKKPEAEAEHYSREPSLASALWLTHHTTLKIWCAGFFDDAAQSKKLAATLGLVGIIERAPLIER